MRGIDPLQPRFACGGMRAEVAADVACGQPDGTQAGDGEMREVLTFSGVLIVVAFGSNTNSR